jgi:hypothetical protein
MVFAPGSVIGEGSYSWEIEEPIAECPEWLATLIGEAKQRERKEQAEVPLSEDAEIDILRGKQWIEEQEPAIEGQGGDSATYRVMQVLRDYGLSVEKCAEIVSESEWNQKCDPPWDYDELLVKAKNAATYSYGEQGNRSITVEFREDGEDGDDYACEVIDDDDDSVRLVMDPTLVEMNQKHSKQAQGRKVIVWCQEDSELGSHWAPYSTSEFDKLYEHLHKEVGNAAGGSKLIPLGRWWREHPKHMRSKGVTMDMEKPSGPTGVDKPFNLWCGWGIRPRKSKGGGSEHYQRLVEEALCSGDSEHAEYVFNWCSLLIQKPTVMAKVAVVFRGEKGTGKSTLGLAMVDALGPHAVKVDRLSAVTGQFNWHLKNKVFLLAEEIKWLQERGAEGVLKSLITDHHKGFEAKGIDMIEGINYLSVMINSNSEWVVPVSTQDERRFAVFDVANILRKDHALWANIYAGNSGRLQKEPLADFLYWLQRRDIGGFDPIREVPYTQALVDQSIESLDFIEKWWYGKIEEGLIPGTGEDWDIEADIDLPVELLYRDYMNSVPQKYRKTRHNFGRRMAQFGVAKVRVRVNGKRSYVYQVPPKDVAEARFFAQVDWM